MIAARTNHVPNCFRLRHPSNLQLPVVSSTAGGLRKAMNASRMRVAGNKKDKDRPKSSEKPRGRNKERGTPDNKPSTPGPDDDSNSDARSCILNDEEIQNLAIRQDALNQIRESLTAEAPPLAPRDVRPINVRKINKNPPPKRLIKSITVAKGAPPRAPLKPVETEGNSGPRFDGNGNIIAHSILGTLEEYKVGAEQKGELAVDYYIREQDRVQTPTTLPECYRKSVLVKGETRTQPLGESIKQSNALINWQNKMVERKIQQGSISKLLGKPEEDLVMNEEDNYREKQELRYLIDRSIPAVDYGKGYRVGSEFWQQRPLIGDEETGIHMTLSQTNRGYPPPVEHVEVPNSIRKEKRMPVHKQAHSDFQSKPWKRSSFLKQRMSELQPVMHDLDPHKPLADGLEVIGTNNPYTRYLRAATPISERPETPSEGDGDGDENQDPLAKHPDVYLPAMLGPAIKFAGELLQWSGDSHSCADNIAVDARVTFEAYAGCRSTSLLEIINLGTTAIYFSWKMLPKSNPFDLVNASVQRFYFNTSSGVIVPGETLNFPFVFKSDKAGVFCEQWQFQTHPVVSGGAALVVTLRGVALKEDKQKKQRELIENKLQKNIIWKNMRRLVDEIVDSVKSPERPKSPVDSYLTEEELFQRQNPQLHYKHDVVEKLKDLHKMMVNPPTMDGEEDSDEKEDDSDFDSWDLNVTEFKMEVLGLSEDDERKPAFLETINEAVTNLSFPHMSPRLMKMYKTCYNYFSNTVDSISGHSLHLRHLLGLPQREADERLEDSTRISPSSSRRLSTQSSAAASAGKKRQSIDQTPLSAKKTFKRAVAKMIGVTYLNPTTALGSDGGKTAPSKSAPKTAPKEEKKGGKPEPKKETKGKETGKKGDRASPVKKTPPARAAAVASLTQMPATEGRITPAVTEAAPSSANATVDAKLEQKYREKFTAQVYMELERLVSDVTQVFEDIGLSDYPSIHA